MHIGAKRGPIRAFTVIIKVIRAIRVISNTVIALNRVNRAIRIKDDEDR